MKIVKGLAIIILTIIILMILNIKAEATTIIREDGQYNLAKEVEIKILPLMSSKTKGTMNGNISIIEIINDWCRIENETQSGWVRVNILKQSISDETQETEPEKQDNEEPTKPEETTDNNETKPEEPIVTAISKVGYVTVEGLTVRSGPSTSSEAIDGLSKNDKVEIIGEVEGWYQIDLGGDTGYVSAKYISDTKVADTTSRNGNTIKPENITPMEDETQQQNKEEEKTSTSTPTSSSTGAEVAEYAKQYIGYKYVAGGASPEKGFDCSGFTSYVYSHFGVSLSRSSQDQINNGTAIQKSDLQLGDIVIFRNSSNTAIGHVGIYIGDDNFIHAANSKSGVKITSMSTSYYQKRYVGARRVI